MWLFLLVSVRSFPEGIAGFDLASGVQSSWLIGNGQSPDISLLNGDSYLARNAAYIIYPISQLTRVFPAVGTLLFIQSFAISLAVVPLFNIARKLGKLHFGTCTAIVIVYSTYVSVHNLNLSGFSPAALALPALLYVMYLGLSTQNINTWQFGVRYWPLILWILACRADLGLAVAGFGALLMLEKKRHLGLATLGVGLGWVILSVLVVQAMLGEGYPAIEFYESYGNNPLSVFWGMLSDPGRVIGDIRTSQNFDSIISLLAPLVFLPLVRPRYFLPVLPLYFFYLIADTPTDVLGEAEQNVAMIAFLFLATIFALKRIGNVLVERVRVNLYLLWVLILAAGMFFIQDSVSSFYNEPWEWNDRQSVLEEVVDEVPKDDSVRATSNLLSSLAERDALYELDTSSGNPRVDARMAVQNVDWIILDTTAIWADDPAAVMDFTDELEDRNWNKVGERDGVLTYQR